MLQLFFNSQPMHPSRQVEPHSLLSHSNGQLEGPKTFCMSWTCVAHRAVCLVQWEILRTFKCIFTFIFKHLVNTKILIKCSVYKSKYQGYIIEIDIKHLKIGQIWFFSRSIQSLHRSSKWKKRWGDWLEELSLQLSPDISQVSYFCQPEQRLP